MPFLNIIFKCFVPGEIMEMAASISPSSEDRRLLSAASLGQTDLVLQLLEENGSELHNFKDQVLNLFYNFRIKF